MRFLHWLTVALVVVQVAFAGLNLWLYEQRPILAEGLVQAHVSLGAVLLAVTLVRIAVRRFRRRAGSSASDRPTVAGAVQFCLYLCLLVLPVSGYIRLAALGFQIELFGVVPLPNMPSEPELAIRAAATHDTVVIIFMGAMLAHVSGALIHRR